LPATLHWHETALMCTPVTLCVPCTKHAQDASSLLPATVSLMLRHPGMCLHIPIHYTVRTLRAHHANRSPYLKRLVILQHSTRTYKHSKVCFAVAITEYGCMSACFRARIVCIASSLRMHALPSCVQHTLRTAKLFEPVRIVILTTALHALSKHLVLQHDSVWQSRCASR